MEDDEELSAEEDSSSEEEILKPPETRELPQRVTRGRRYKRLSGSEAELDESFWGDATWHEEQNDEEWSTENEGHYKDEFDSDFLESTDSDEETAIEQTGDALDKHVKRFDNKNKSKFDYNKVAQKRAKRKIQSNKQWSVLHIQPSQTAKGKKGSAVDKRLWSQQEHMAEAKKTEALNVEILAREVLELEEVKLRGEMHGQAKEASVEIKCPIDLWISWSSDRTIEAEEGRKSQHQRELEASQPPHERQLLMFLNPREPNKAQLDPLYTTHTPPHTPPMHRPIYTDPITKQQFSTIAEFQAIRQKTIEDELQSVSAIVAKHLPQTDKSITQET